MLGYSEDGDWDRVDIFHFRTIESDVRKLTQSFQTGQPRLGLCYRKLWVHSGPTERESLPTVHVNWRVPLNSSLLTLAKESLELGRAEPTNFRLLTILRERQLLGRVQAYKSLVEEPRRRIFFLNLVKFRDYAIDDLGKATSIPGLPCAVALHAEIPLFHRAPLVPPPFGQPSFLMDGERYLSLGTTSDFVWDTFVVKTYQNVEEAIRVFEGKGNMTNVILCDTSCWTCALRHLILDVNVRICHQGDSLCYTGTDV